MNSSIFRTYDIRGRIPADLALSESPALIEAILRYYQAQDPTLDTIVLGNDARITSAQLAHQVQVAAERCQLKVKALGLVSSPEFYHTLHTGEHDSGIMITASHNDAEYNGFKLRLHKKPVWGSQLQDIKQHLDHGLPTSTTAIHAPWHKTTYHDDLAQRFEHLKDLNLHALIDCGNGATGPVVTKLLKTLGFTNITTLYDCPDGAFPYHNPDSSNPRNLTTLINRVKHAKVPTIGFALDGDGDRLAVILEDGTHLSGDDILALLVGPVLKKNPGTHVVYDIKSSSRLTRVISSLQGHGHFIPCGHTYIQDAMEKHDALIGGEVSGHLFFRDRYFGFDDGIYALLRVLELRHEANIELTELFKQLPSVYAVPEVRIACTNKDAVVQHALTIATQLQQPVTVNTTDGVRIEFAQGWILVRAAQTEPALSIRWEGTDQSTLKMLEQLMHQLIAIASPPK